MPFQNLPTTQSQSPSGATAEDYQDQRQIKFSAFREISTSQKKEQAIEQNRRTLLEQLASLYLEIFLSEQDNPAHNGEKMDRHAPRKFERPNIVLQETSSKRYRLTITLSMPEGVGTCSIENPKDHSLMTIARDFPTFINQTLSNIYYGQEEATKNPLNLRSILDDDDDYDEEEKAHLYKWDTPDTPLTHSTSWHLLYGANKIQQHLFPLELMFISYLWLRATSLTPSLRALIHLESDTAGELLGFGDGLLAFTPLAPTLEDWPIAGSASYAAVMLALGAYLLSHYALATIRGWPNNGQLEKSLDHTATCVLPRISCKQHLEFMPIYINGLSTAAMEILALNSSIILLDASTDNLSDSAERAMFISLITSAALSAAATLTYCKNYCHGGWVYLGLLSTLVLSGAYVDLSTHAAQDVLRYGQYIFALIAVIGSIGQTVSHLPYFISRQPGPWPTLSMPAWLVYPAFLLKITPHVVHLGLMYAFLALTVSQLCLNNQIAHHGAFTWGVQITALLSAAYQKCITDFTYDNAVFSLPNLYCAPCIDIVPFFRDPKTYAKIILLGAFVLLFYVYKGFEPNTNPFTQYGHSFIPLLVFASCLPKYKSFLTAAKSHNSLTKFLDYLSLALLAPLWTCAIEGFFNPHTLENPVTTKTLTLFCVSFIVSSTLAYLTKENEERKQKTIEKNTLKTLKSLYHKVRLAGSLSTPYKDLKQYVTDTASLATREPMLRHYRETQKQQLIDVRFLMKTYKKYRALPTQAHPEADSMFWELGEYHYANSSTIDKDTQRAHTLARGASTIITISLMLVFAPNFLGQCFNTIEYPGLVAMSLPVAIHMIPRLYEKTLARALQNQEPSYGESRALKNMINGDHTTGDTLGAIMRVGRRSLFSCCKKAPRENEYYQALAGGPEDSHLSVIQL